MKKYTKPRIAMLTVLLALMVATVAGVRSFIEDQIVELKEQDLCWFLTDRVENVLVADLVMWTEHVAHNDDATMAEWFDLRVPEVVTMNSSMGITAAEVTTCLESLKPEVPNGQ